MPAMSDAQALGLGAPGAVIGLLFPEIVFDLGVRQSPQGYPVGNNPFLKAPGAGIQKAEGGVKHHGFAGHEPQLPEGILVDKGLAQCHSFQHCHLIRTDDQGVRRVGRDGSGLGLSETRRRGFRCLPGKGRLIHVGNLDLECQLQAGQQLVPVGRAGCQNNLLRFQKIIFPFF